jgi:hypothetical protein
MSSVQLFHVDSAGNETLVGVVDGDLIKKHSAEVRNLIATRPYQIVHKVTLRGPSVEGLRYVLNEIQTLEPGKALEITTKTRNIEQAIDIHRAIHCMKIEPTQTRVEGHLNGFLSHQLATPDEMVAIHNAYGSPNSRYNKIWKTMIHTIAYKWVGGGMNKTQSGTSELSSPSESLGRLRAEARYDFSIAGCGLKQISQIGVLASRIDRRGEVGCGDKKSVVDGVMQ